MTTNRRWIYRAIMIVTAGIALQQLWRHGHDYVFPSRFVTVERGKIFRGAWQKPWPMRAIIHDHKIKTVVALAHPPDDPLVIQERKLAAELGVKWLHIPIVDQRGTADKSAEEAVSDLIDEARSTAWPIPRQSAGVFFHCHHGHRTERRWFKSPTGPSTGWLDTQEQAADEIEHEAWVSSK